MTKTISSSRNSTLDSLLNTLRNFWVLLKPQNERWREVRADAIAEQRLYKKAKKKDTYARRNWDILHERVTYSDGMCMVETLVGDLIIVLEENPYPGEQRTVLNVAVELFPEAKVMLAPKVFISGKNLWVRVFDEGAVNHWEKVYFPIKSEAVDIAKMEQLLWERVREDGTILAAEVPEALNLKVNGKVYRDVKSKLQERGWVWKVVKRNKGVSKVVVAPNR